MIWVVCGAGRGVGKTHLAQQLCRVLPNAVYAKQGCGERRPDGPENFFRSDTELESFLAQSGSRHEHVIIESNEQARHGKGDVIIFIDAVPEETDIRDDVQTLLANSHLQVNDKAEVRDWKRELRGKLEDSVLREAVCDCLMQQKRHLFKGRPEVRVKMWLVEGGMHVFGAGLARLLANVERRGTLRDAAKATHMSYRHAWGLIKNAEKHHGQPLVIQQPGGVGGGQSALSEHGRQLLRRYQDVSRKIQTVADSCFGEAGGAEKMAGRKDRLETVGAEPPAGDSTATQAVRPLRISTAGAPPVHDSCEVVIEVPLTITIEDVGSFTVLCTPGDVEALAVGFAFSEGMIGDAGDIVDLRATADPPVVALRLDDPSRVVGRRNLIVTSSCGMCGQRNIDRLLAEMKPAGQTLRVSGELLLKLVREMRAAQSLFARTGGTHAAGIFSAGGELLAVGEDIGRHNALDKAIGKCLLSEQETRGCGAVLSGRVSLELVAKAARAGIELMAAVSAPSSLALEAARRANITLCGFVRDTRATIYTHPGRVVGQKTSE